MKKLLMVLALSLTASLAYSQKLELKTTPVAIPFNIWQVNVEFLINEDIGIEPGIVFIPEIEDALISVLCKYYFYPKVGNDAFHIGMFLNSTVDDFIPGIGFYTGYKWISKRGITFELGAGLGRVLGSFGSDYDYEVTGIGQASVGYRFGYNKNNK